MAIGSTGLNVDIGLRFVPRFASGLEVDIGLDVDIGLRFESNEFEVGFGLRFES